jgi:hypothetical protein
MFKNVIVFAQISIVVMMTACLLTSCKRGFGDARTDMSQRGDADILVANGKEQRPADDSADVTTSGQSPVGESSDPQTNVFWKLGFNEVRSDAPIHIHFAEALPSDFGRIDVDWDWESWKTGTESLLKDELFPLLGAYEHYYFLIDYEGYNEDDEEIVALARTIGDSQDMTKDSFTGISGMHFNADGWRVPLHMSRIPDDAHMQHVLEKYKYRRPEEGLFDQLRSSVIHEYHHIMMWHQMMNNYQSRNSRGTVAEPDYLPPWFSEGAAAVLPYLLGTDNGREGLRGRIEHVLDMVKTDPLLDFEHMKDWDTWTKPPLSFDPFIPLACYMAHRSSWQVALVDTFRAMGLQPYPGDLDALLVTLVGVNEHDFLNEALAFFRLEGTTADTLMPPDVPVAKFIGPPSLTTLAQERP